MAHTETTDDTQGGNFMNHPRTCVRMPRPTRRHIPEAREVSRLRFKSYFQNQNRTNNSTAERICLRDPQDACTTARVAALACGRER